MVLHYQSRFQEIKLTQKIQKKNVTTQTTNAYTMCGKTMHQGIINFFNLYEIFHELSKWLKT